VCFSRLCPCNKQKLSLEINTHVLRHIARSQSGWFGWFVLFQVIEELLSVTVQPPVPVFPCYLLVSASLSWLSSEAEAPGLYPLKRGCLFNPLLQPSWLPLHHRTVEQKYLMSFLSLELHSLAPSVSVILPLQIFAQKPKYWTSYVFVPDDEVRWKDRGS